MSAVAGGAGAGAGASAGSGTGQARKLGLKPGMRVALDEAPGGWSFQDPPVGLVFVDGGVASVAAASSSAAASSGAAVDLVVAFFTAASAIEGRVPDLAKRIHPAGSLWCAWPRRAGGHESDITDTVLREIVLEHPLLGHALVDTKVAAIDADWSGLKFVWRVEHRR